MLGLFKKLRHFNNRKEFMKFFFSIDEHQWMNQSRYIKAHFEDFFEYVPMRIINKLFSEQDVFFVPSSGRFSCSVESHKKVIIVFPELMQLLKAPFDGYAKAIIAHELGHVYHAHSSKLTDPMESQVEADALAIELGFVNQLVEFLEEQPESLEKRLRLTYCTSHIFSEV